MGGDVDVSRDLFGESTAGVEVGPALEAAATPAGNRYVLLEPLGTGGFAIVYTAYDRKLDRKIAVKLLREDARQTALLREAQALARLRHPNVVTVHDTGTFGAQVFIAMDLIEGTSLGRWLADEPRDWREVLRVFLDAGRGLAAAHAQGLVHRDFKPDNVLVGHDGAVRVADFGLALLLHEPETGAIVGTPRYMPPEQRAGARVDARADQYAFCVALNAALASRPRVPRRFFAILRRGAGDDPASRYPTMDALLAELARIPVIRRRRALAALAAGVLAALAALAVTRERTAREDPCAGAAARLAGAWDEATRARVRGVFLATGRPYADDTFQRVGRRLDEYAAGWAAMRTETCAATHVRHEQADALFDLRMECLDQRRQALSSLAAVLGRAPDPEVLDRAISAADQLPDLKRCGDREALTAAMPPPPPEQRARVDAVRRRVEQARALAHAGKVGEAVPLAAAALQEARDVTYPPLVADALRVLFMAQWDARELSAAHKTGDEALVASALARDDVLVARNWISLVLLISIQGRAGDALALVPVAQAATARAGDPPFLRGLLSATVGRILNARGDYAGAEQALVEGLRHLEPSSDLIVPQALNALALAQRNQGKYEEARVTYERALALIIEAVGPDNPTRVFSELNLGSLLFFQGRPAEARVRVTRALAIATGAQGSDGPEVASAEHRLGDIAYAEEQHDEARAHYQRALALSEKRFGPDHSSLPPTLNGLAQVAIAQGRPAEAVPLLERALAVRRQARGAGHPGIAFSLAVLAGARLAGGAASEALVLADQAVAHAEKTVGGEHPRLAYCLATRAEVHAAARRFASAEKDDARALAVRERATPGGVEEAYSLAALAERRLALGRAAEAIPLLERALSIQQRVNPAPAVLARVRFALARASWADGRKSMALVTAEEAARDYAALGEPRANDRSLVERWLRARRR